MNHVDATGNKPLDIICQDWATFASGTTSDMPGELSLVDCPQGGCLAFAFTLPDGFVGDKTYQEVGAGLGHCFLESAWIDDALIARGDGLSDPYAASRGRTCLPTTAWTPDAPLARLRHIELNHVAVRVSNEKRTYAGTKVDWPFGDMHTLRFELTLGSPEVGHGECHVRVTRVLVWQVHQDVLGLGGRGVENEVHDCAGGMVENGDGLWAHGAGDEPEAQPLVERPSPLEVSDANPNMRNSSDKRIESHVLLLVWLLPRLIGEHPL